MKHFDLLHGEIAGAGEENLPVHAALVRLTVVFAVKERGVVATGRAVVRNSQVLKDGTPKRIAPNRRVIAGLQQLECRRRKAVWILQREQETPKTGIRLQLCDPWVGAFVRLPFDRREAAEDIPIRVSHERQSGTITIAATVEISGAEAVAAPAPEQMDALVTELSE